MTGIFVTPLIYVDRIVSLLGKFSQGKFWILRFTVILAISFNLIYFPEAIIKKIKNSWTVQDLNVQSFLNEKINEPLKPFEKATDNDHFSKRELRLTPYVVGKLLGLNSGKLFYLQIALLPVFIFGLLKVLYSFSRDKVISILGTICLMYCYVGNSFNYDTLFLDSFAYLGLLGGVLLRMNLLAIPVLVLTYFVDERSVIPSLIIPLLTYMELKLTEPGALSIAETNGVKSILRNMTIWIVLIAIAIYILGRQAFLQFGLHTPIGQENGVAFGQAFLYMERISPAILSSLKTNFIILFLGITYLHKNRGYFMEGWLVSIFALTLAVSLSVEDVTRSLAYSFPVVLASFLLMRLDKNNNLTRRYMVALAAINFLTPTYTLILDLNKIKMFGWTSIIL